MSTFSPNFNDSITTTDDVVMILIMVAIFFFCMALAEEIIFYIHLARTNRYRKKIKKEHEFPKYLEDDE